ncbi:D-lactate dehydrogenase [Acinetobacter dispersus]|uniref:D-lactate dehydrogenase n=1 Tax=Acinetobacter dispersus TaxID=70348 RepID=UPI001F4B8A27|nr:D-lactate dehydrogenase [Acinetobacter dispersus]MCH7394113.1 D-lactate dehydrogenase [Acinetobacter dispersus]
MQNNLIIDELKGVLKPHQILTKVIAKAPYLKGFRIGKGEALAVVIPDSLLELWKILECCVKHNVIMILQAANTGVTGGSTPDSNNYDRDVLVISTLKLKGLQLLEQATQVIAFPGTTLTELEKALKPYQREPHSVIGSSCIGASVIGGVCNNSGGSLIHRGPTYTEKSLFAQIDDTGKLVLVNHLGIDLGETPEEIFGNLERQKYVTGQAATWSGRIWADNYADSLRDTTSPTPTRFNGNPEYLHESAGCSGKLAVFAVRLPTFEAATQTCTYFIGSHDESELIQLRKYLLQHLSVLPTQAEYMHRQSFEHTQRYAKHMYKTIDIWGAEKIPMLLVLKSRIDAFCKRVHILPNNMTDRLIQLFNRLTPTWVEPRLQAFQQKYQHLLMLKIDTQQNDELKHLFMEFFQGQTEQFFQCSEKEEKNVFLIRFAVGGCMVYYCDREAIDPNERLVSFDVAFRRNDQQWLIELPEHLRQQVIMEISAGHFFCFVLHQDYLLKEGVNARQFKNEVLTYLQQRGAKYPAEHNIGHLYQASPDYSTHLKQLDPTNSFNPGIGKTSKHKYWR